MTLRIALLHHDFGNPPRPGVEHVVRDVAVGLRARGHDPVVLSAHPALPTRSLEDRIPVVRVTRLTEGLMRRRGFTGPLTHLPLTLRALHRGRYDIAHAFSAPDAVAALRWRRSSGIPVAFTCAEPIARSHLSNERLRLRLLNAALDYSDSVVATDERVREALWRWMAVEATVLAPSDGLGHDQLYRRLLAERQSQGRW